MKYIDNGTGDPREDALFPWLRDVLTEAVIGIRWQSGFFEASVLGVFVPTLQRLADNKLDAIVLIGSNDGDTQSSAVHQLVDALRLPRPNALLGVVSYADGFYHPKDHAPLLPQWSRSRVRRLGEYDVAGHQRA